MTTNEWDEYASGWDTNEDAREYANKAFDTFEQNVAPALSAPSTSRVLDFGCGTGLLAEKLAGRCGEIVAIDSSPKMIEVLKKKIKRLGVSNVVASDITVSGVTFRDHPLFSKRFDLIVASSVCSFLPDYESTLRDLSSIMTPDGWFVQWDWIWDMPVERIRNAFRASGLVEHSIGKAFVMESNGRPAPVVMGIGRKRS